MATAAVATRYLHTPEEQQIERDQEYAPKRDLSKNDGTKWSQDAHLPQLEETIQGIVTVSSQKEPSQPLNQDKQAYDRLKCDV